MGWTCHDVVCQTSFVAHPILQHGDEENMPLLIRGDVHSSSPRHVGTKRTFDPEGQEMTVRVLLPS